jgi:hypothetical protein
LTEPPPSPKSRLRPVYTVPDDPPVRTERVIYQLEDAGHPELRLRPSVYFRDENGAVSHVYRVDAFSRLTGRHLGRAEVVAPPGSPAEFAAEARQFQSPAFQQAVDALRERLVEQFAGAEPTGIVQG